MNDFIKYLCVFLFFYTCNAGIIKNNNKENYYFPELEYIDENINPCDNFYKFACGNFEKFHPRPEKEPLWDNFKILQKQINDKVTNILNSTIRLYDAEAVKKAKDMYFACVNPTLSAEQSITPISDAFNKLGGWPIVTENSNTKFSWEFLGEIIANFGLQIIFNWEIQPYYWDANMNMMTIGKDALQLPVSAISELEDFQSDIEIETDFKANEANRPYYMQYLIDVAKKFVRPDHMTLFEAKIEQGIEQAYEILIKINQLREEDSDMEEEEYGYIDTIEDLQEWTDTFSSNFKTRINWISFFTKAYSKTDVKITKDLKVNVSLQYVIKSLLTLVENTPDDVIINFIFARLATFMSQDANNEMWEMFNDLYRKLKNTVYTREEYCMRKVTSYPGIGLSLAVAHEYQNYHFDLRKISKPEQMIEDMLEAFFELLNEKDWLDEPAKEWVRNKANNMLRLVAFPEYVYDRKQLDKYYADLQICAHDHFGNAQRLRAFNMAKNIETIDKPRKRDIWSQSPLLVNAFYNAGSNRITFPSGIMEQPFFSATSKLVDYSRIGALIGHEITHGFDTNGRNMDENGTVIPVDPWSKDVKNIFDQKSKCFIEQYSQYHIEEINANVNASLTNRENIADNGGLREAFRAFQNLNKKSSYSPEQFSGKYSPEQLFFISYASMWCKIDTVQSLQTMNNKDPHAPNRFRVIGTLSNMQEFSEAFNCKIGSPMNPENKCVLW